MMWHIHVYLYHWSYWWHMWFSDGEIRSMEVGLPFILITGLVLMAILKSGPKPEPSLADVTARIHARQHQSLRALA